MRKKVWVYDPRKIKNNPTDEQKKSIKEKCDRFIESELKPHNIKPFDPKNKVDIQHVDIYSKWYRNYLYFIVKCKDLRPNVISNEREEKIARLEFMESDRFRLCYLRHTGEWFDLTFSEGTHLKNCFESIKEMPHFALI